MHFHLPKPMHGWREFVGEVGIIVIGVLIALGAEQLVEAARWREQVSAGREALRDDYINIIVNAREREGEDACIRRRLSDLTIVLNDGGGILPPLGTIGNPPGRIWYPVSWDSLVASNVSVHMPRNEMLAHAQIAVQARMAENTSQQELYDWAKLYSMVGKGRKLDGAESGQLRESIAVALYRLNLLRLVAPQIEQSVLETGLLTKDDMRNAAKNLSRSKNGPNWRTICGPIQPPSGRIAEAPYDPSVQLNPLQ